MSDTDVHQVYQWLTCFTQVLVQPILRNAAAAFGTITHLMFIYNTGPTRVHMQTS